MLCDVHFSFRSVIGREKNTRQVLKTLNYITRTRLLVLLWLTDNSCGAEILGRVDTFN